MNITFLVGNGFDIRMGIKSSYKQVEEYYIGLDKKDKHLKMFQNSLAVKGEYWANFEKALGQYTADFQDNEQSIFQLCLNDFTEELIDYLKLEELKVDFELCSEEIRNEFIRSISKYDNDIPDRYRNAINAIINSYGNILFRFVSFNYTHLLDKCLKLSFTKDVVVGKHSFKGAVCNHLVNSDVLHIHGELPGPIVMGVDNKDQINNKNWAQQRRFCQKLAKPDINSRAGRLIDDKVQKLIIESNIICIYGMSLGETDKTWWKLIGSWLRGNNRMLILYVHHDNDSQGVLTYQQQFVIQEKYIDEFLDVAEINGQERAVLENKIIVVINPDLFNINLVQISKERSSINSLLKV